MRSKTKWLLLVGLAFSSLALVHCVSDEPAGSVDDAGSGTDSGTTPDNYIPPGDSGAVDSGGDAATLCSAGNVTCGAGVSPCIIQIAGGGSTYCARDTSCNVYCWGANAEGQLGQDPSTTPFSATAVKINLGSLISTGLDVAGDFDPDMRGEGVVCARVAANTTTSTTIMCWGSNRFGQLGVPDAGSQVDDGGLPISTTPIAVPGLSNIPLVNAGARHECVMTSGGLVDCWGDNFYGELGRTTGTNVDPTATPITFSGTVAPEADGVIGVGYVDTCIIDSTKHVWCVGANGQKQLASDAGDDTKSSATFSQINGVTNAAALIANGKAICAITASKTVLCWGQNDHQQMGNNTAPTDQVVPSTPTGLAAAGAGGGQAGAEQFCVNIGTLPLTDGGTTPNIQCWGGNAFGQAVTPTDGGDLATPTQVQGLPNGYVARLAPAATSSCALMNDGTVWCWGQNSNGALGKRDGSDGNDGTIKGPGRFTF